jgi:hypothetical protein
MFSLDIKNKDSINMGEALGLSLDKNQQIATWAIQYLEQTKSFALAMEKMAQHCENENEFAWAMFMMGFLYKEQQYNNQLMMMSKFN